MPSFELPLVQRVATALLLIAAAWFGSSFELLQSGLGESAVRITAGVAAVSVVLGMKIPLGLWRRRIEVAGVRWVPALSVAVIAAAVFYWSGNAGRAEAAWLTDRGGAALFVIGAAAWSTALAKIRAGSLAKWMLVAAACGILPGAIAVGIVRTSDWSALSVDGGALAGGIVFLAVLDVARMLVTDELAFRRLIVGRSREVGLVMVGAGAFLYGIWFAFTGTDDGSAGIAFLDGVIRGALASGLFVASRSILVSAIFSGSFAAVVAGGAGAMVAGGTSAELVGNFRTWTMVLASLAALAFMVSVYRDRGFGQLAEFEIEHDATDG